MEAAQKLQKGKKNTQESPKQLDIKEISPSEPVPKQIMSPVLNDKARNLLTNIQRPSIAPTAGMKVGG